MLLFENRIGMTRSITCVAAAFAILSANIDQAFAGVAWDPSNQHAVAAVPSGAVAMLRLRVPFGGADQRHSQPTLAFAAGPEWRDLSGSPDFVGYGSGGASVEAGWTFAGEPIVRLGSVDMLHAASVQANAAGLDDLPNWVYIAGGVAVIAIIAVAVSSGKKNGGSGGMGGSGGY